jgi:hypothetical protein
MSKARLTVGRSLLVESGLKEVQRVLGIGRGGSTGDVYSNRDADQLDDTLRRVRRQLRGATELPASSQMWWKTPTLRLIDYLAEERDLVELSRVSIEILRAQEATSTTLRTAAATLTRVVKPAKLIERARDESTGDHPLLHGHSLVAIWGAIETMAIDVVAAWLENWAPAREADHIAQIKVPYSTFDKLTPTERIEALANELDQQRSTRKGIDRFEKLLDAIGLSGTRDPVLADNIYEMQQIRNVFAHKRGIADRRFAVEACPHLGYAVGERILIDRNTWSDFMVNALLYAELVHQRMKQQLGVPVNERPPVARAIRYSTR